MENEHEFDYDQLQDLLYDETEQPSNQNEEIDESIDDNQIAIPTTYDLGELGQASLDDIRAWKNGHLMQNDYTQKTQAIAEERRQMDAIRQQMESQYAPYKQFEQLIGSNPQLQQQITALLQQQQTFNPLPNPEIQTLKSQYENQLQSIQQEMAYLKNQETGRAMRNEWNTLVSKYPDAESLGPQIAELADNRGFDLETAYRVLNYDKVAQNTREEMVKNQLRKKENHTYGTGGTNGSNQPTFDPRKATTSEITNHVIQNYKLFD